jgi:AraC-like DNA-binding protein
MFPVMSQSAPQFDRIFLRAPYVLHHRRARRLQWTGEATSSYIIFFLLDGKLLIDSADSSIELEGQGILFLNPFAQTIVTSRSAEYLTLTLAPSYLLDCAVRIGLISRGAQITFRHLFDKTDERLLRLAHDLAYELTSEETGQETVVAALVEQAMVQLLRHHANLRRSDELEISRVGLVDRRIRRAVELMHAHLDRDLPLEELASAAYLSPFHFARLFKKSTGASPHAYLATLRTTRAQTLLAETDLSVSEVSARVGYSSPSHFTKAFRQATGLTPRAYRAALVKG